MVAGADESKAKHVARPRMTDEARDAVGAVYSISAMRNITRGVAKELGLSLDFEEIDDLIHRSLVFALPRYDPAKGTKLTTYVGQMIRHEIQKLPGEWRARGIRGAPRKDEAAHVEWTPMHERYADSRVMGPESDTEVVDTQAALAHLRGPQFWGRVLAALPPAAAPVVCLKYCGGLSNADCARRLGVSTRVVYEHLQTAKEALQTNPWLAKEFARRTAK